nr:putative reverse transcriptase domain-containing protein [Tanacetum cinerariifolium]
MAKPGKPTIVEEDGTTRTKRYEELLVAEKLQADCDLKATNIVRQGLPQDVYAIVNHHKVAKEIWDRVKLLMQGMKLSLQEKEWSLWNKFKRGKDKVMLLVLGGNNTGGLARVAKCYNCQGEGHMARQCTQPKRPRNAAWFKEKAMLAEAQEPDQILDEEQLAFLADPGIPDGQATHITIPNTAAFQTKDLDAYDSNCDDVSNAKAILMANLSNYGSDVISKEPHFEPYHTDTDNQTVQDANLYAQQDSMILIVIEQIVISSQHVASPVIDDEETLILEEVSLSKMLAKQNDPMSKEKKVNTTLINYVDLNRLSEDFGKHFVPQQELSDEQPFWSQTLHPNIEQSASSPVKIKAPKELSKPFRIKLYKSNQGKTFKGLIFRKRTLRFDSYVLSLAICQMHNNIMAAGSRDRPPMLATGRYPQWRSRFLRYIDTRRNGDALRKCILSSPYKPTTVLVQAVAATDDSPAIPEHIIVETPMNMSPENKAHFQAEKDAIHLILTEIRDEIYSTVDACQTAQEMWEAIKRLQQGKEIAKPITPPSKTASEEDSDPKQAQRDKDMQKNLALIAKYFKKIYKPTNKNLRTSSNLRNKNVDTTLR